MIVDNRYTWNQIWFMCPSLCHEIPNADGIMHMHICDTGSCLVKIRWNQKLEILTCFTIKIKLEYILFDLDQMTTDVMNPWKGFESCNPKYIKNLHATVHIVHVLFIERNIKDTIQAYEVLWKGHILGESMTL
jgi:hypothetical protein